MSKDCQIVTVVPTTCPTAAQDTADNCTPETELDGDQPNTLLSKQVHR